MKNENERRRRWILDEIARSEIIEGWVYCAPRPLVSARERCVSAIVADLVKVGVKSLTLDRVDNGQARRDRVAITRTLSTVATDISYGHAPAWDAAGVQLADAVAWAYGAGGHWRQRLQPILRGNHVDV